MIAPDTQNVALELRILWMDDEPLAVEKYAMQLKIEGAPLVIETVRSIGEARERLKKDRTFLGLVVDCRMDPHDESQNGAEFLLEVNESEKSFPTFVYSAFLGDPRYRRVLDESVAILEERKLASWDRPLCRSPFFAKIISVLEQYQKVKRLFPERIKFSGSSAFRVGKYDCWVT